MAEALKNDVELLNWRHKDFLRSLPNQLNLQFEGVKVQLVHGSPRKNNEDMMIVSENFGGSVYSMAAVLGGILLCAGIIIYALLGA